MSVPWWQHHFLNSNLVFNFHLYQGVHYTENSSTHIVSYSMLDSVQCDRNEPFVIVSPGLLPSIMANSGENHNRIDVALLVVENYVREPDEIARKTECLDAFELFGIPSQVFVHPFLNSSEARGY